MIAFYGLPSLFQFLFSFSELCLPCVVKMENCTMMMSDLCPAMFIYVS